MPTIVEFLGAESTELMQKVRAEIQIQVGDLGWYLGDLSTFRVDASKAGEYICSENYICNCLVVSMPTIVEFLGAESTELMQKVRAEIQIQVGVVGDLSTFRVDASKAGEYIAIAQLLA